MPRVIAGRYRLGDEIGAGGSSRVHVAEDERLGRKVAVKILDSNVVAEADPAGRDRFLREGRTSAGFLHPNAVTIFDAGEDDETLYIVMELVDGPTLAARLAEHPGPFALDETASIIDQVLAALAASHEQGIVHRDVKPANVLLGSGGQVKLADFGIAKRFDELDASITSTGLVIGTPRYLAPEQSQGKEVGPATDVYAVGVMLFELLTGEFPFIADSPIAAAIAHQSHPVPDIGTRRPEAPPRVIAAVERAMAKDPADRFVTAAEMREELADAWADAPVVRLNSTVPLDAAAVAATTTTTTVATRTGSTAVMPIVPVTDATTVSNDEIVAASESDLGTTAAHAPTGSSPMADRTQSPPGVGTDPGNRHEPRRLTGAHLALAAVVLLVVGLIGNALIGGGGNDLAPGQTDDELAALAALADQAPPPEPQEIIPGFAATDDLWQFLAQLESNPFLVGPEGDDLLEDLRKWAEDGEIHPAIAEALDGLLAPIAEQPVAVSGNGGGNSGGPPPGRGNGRGRGNN